jgi:hypothetical protein
MNQLELRENKHLWENIVNYYGQLRTREDGRKPWLDASYYMMLGRWLSAEENCIYMTNKHCLYFKDPRQLTLFVLKWS